MIPHTLYGPPGTGKTTTLLRLLEIELKTTPSDKISFVSYTKKGTYEGVNRAIEKFKLKERDLMYFRTIHSLCFKAIGAKRYDMIDRKHYKLFSEITGIDFTGYYTEDFSSTNDEYLHVVSMEKHNPAFAFELSKQLNEKKLRYIRFQYSAMKKQIGILDFDDLLLEYLEHGQPLPITTAFIDEAQDLTPLQWGVVMKLFLHAKKITIAGDDDQAVYEWSGADINKFLKFSNDFTILEKSYRLPERILQIAKRITQNIRVRQKKDFKSNDNEGLIEVQSKLSDVEFAGGELVLARTNYILKGLSFKLENKGILYNFKGKLSVNKTVLQAITALNKLHSGDISEKEFMPFRGMFHAGYNNNDWQDVLKLGSYQVAYYEKLMCNGGLETTPVDLETFHSSKGSEADTVVMSTDISSRVHDNFNKNIDSELRCLYVGMTRAKKNLTIMLPTSDDHYPQHYFLST